VISSRPRPGRQTTGPRRSQPTRPSPGGARRGSRGRLKRPTRRTVRDPDSHRAWTSAHYSGPAVATRALCPRIEPKPHVYLTSRRSHRLPLPLFGRINPKAMIRVSLAFKMRLTHCYLAPLETVRIEVIDPLSFFIVVTHPTTALGTLSGADLLQRDTPSQTTQRPA